MYVRGETGDPCARVLLAAIEACSKAWAGDRAYRDVLQKLDEAAQALELTVASPGQRAAMRAPEASPAGQEPSAGREPASYVQ